MKTILKQTLTVLAIASTSVFFTSCATLFSGKTTPVILVNCPKGIKVSDNGSPLSVQRVQSHGKHSSEVTVTYYAWGVELDKKQKHHKLTFESNGVQKSHDVKLKANGAFVVLDLFTTGPLGIIIDAATKKWRKAKDRHIDVNAVLTGTEPLSQRKLKKLIRQQANN